MASDQLKRKLAAILAADIAGYSRLMGADEAGTLARLKQYRRELIDPKNKQYRGRVVKTTGDGILIEFPSVVDAVSCSIEVQQGMRDSPVMISSTMPSVKYSCSGSPLMFWNGRTAIDGLSGKASTSSGD